jgi:CheY-like chemotaxis protein
MQPHILVIEDEEDSGEVMADILEYHGLGSMVATNAEIGLELVASNDFDAAIIDLALPGMDGIAMVRKLRAMAGYETLPCIACTAYHTSKVRQEALAAGFDAYITKPLTQASLMTVLRGWIDVPGGG